MDNTILKNKKIHQATLLVYKGSDVKGGYDERFTVCDCEYREIIY